MKQQPTIGRIVIYALNSADVDRIQSRRRSGLFNGEPAGNGLEYPMLVTAVEGAGEEVTVSGQVFLNGNDTHWVHRISEGDGPGFYRWPARA